MVARLTQLRPMLEVGNIDETVTFWRDSLGFSVVATFEESWVLMERDGLRVMFSLHEGDHTHDPGASSLYFDVDDVDALHAELSSRGAAGVHGAPETYPWGMRQFAVTDSNGFLLQFGSPAE